MNGVIFSCSSMLYKFRFLERKFVCVYPDFTTASVSMSSESESVNHSMPEDISVHVTIGGQDVRLQLKLDHNANTDIPVYVFSRNKDGELETKKVHRKKEKVDKTKVTVRW